MNPSIWEPAPAGSDSRLDRPILIVSTPRSGSTLLFEALAQAPKLFTTPGESHGRIERIGDFAPRNRDWTSNRLDAGDATADHVEQMSAGFLADLVDRDGTRPSGVIRMLEKTPKNALRVPFFNAAWPDSIFVYLYRDVRETLASMLEAWLSGRFRTYPGLPGWTGPPWSLLLVPGWEQLRGLPTIEIVAHQWRITTDLLIDDLEQLPRERLRGLSYDELVANPQRTVTALATSLGLQWDRDLSAGLPLSRSTISRPTPEKWHRLTQEMESVWEIVAKTDARARTFLQRIVN